MAKAYTGFAKRPDAADDFGAMSFFIKQLMNTMATATLVLVKAVDAEKKTVDVQPMVSQIDGAGNAIDHGTAHSLPYFALRAGASAVLATPKAGDIGLAVYCHNDISSVKKNKAPANPGSRRRFDWADGLYLGGFLGPTPTQFITLDDDAGITIQSASGKPVSITAPGGLLVDGDVTITGKLTQTGGDIDLTGTLSFTGDLSVSGTVTGETDVVGNGKSLHDHIHSGVQTGSGNTGAPV